MTDTPIADGPRAAALDTRPEQTMTELVAGIAEDARELIRQQYQMLRAELREDIRRTTSAAKYMGLGVAASLVGTLFVVIAFPLLVSWAFDLPHWAGWAIVGGLLLIGGAIAFIVGRRMFQKFNPLPDKTLNALEENISWATRLRS